MSQPVVSVVIAAFNEENYLPHCLASLRAQANAPPFEVIVVDNNSTDRTTRVAKHWGARIGKEKKQGIGPAKAKGARLARGKIITFLDADMTVLPHWLERIEANLSQAGVVATGGPYLFRTKKKTLKIISCLHLISLIFFRGLPGGNFSVRKDVFQKVGGFDPETTFGEDIDLSLKVKKEGKVKVDWQLRVTESGRRYEQQGVMKTLLEYLPSLLGVLLKNPRLIEKGRLKTFR